MQLQYLRCSARHTHTHHRDRTCISHRGARAIAMRVLNDSRPTVAPDASSAPPLLITPTAAAGMVGVVQLQPGAAGGSDAGFDADMVVILAALLCVLVCALGVNSLVHHFVLNCGRTVAAPAPPHAAAAAAPATDSDSTGLKKRELRRIPVVLYEANKPSASSATDDNDDCAICLGEFDDGEELRLLPGCHHGFHVQCIDVWLLMHASCPTCRNSLLVHQHRHAGDGDGEAATVAGEEA
jgi:E3 ubiquitin-protein ligase ATL10/75/76/77/78